MYISAQPRFCCILTFDPAKHAIPKTAEILYSVGVGELGWQYGTGLKSHSTVTNWCTRREWPVNCMTVISTWWRSNMPFQRRQKCIFQWSVMGRDWEGIELLYNSVHSKFKEFWRPERWRNNAVEKTAPSREMSPQASSWAAQENGKETLMAIRVGVNMLQFCSVSNSLSCTTLSIKWEVYFSKNCIVCHYCVVVMILHAYEYTTLLPWMWCRVIC